MAFGGSESAERKRANTAPPQVQSGAEPGSLTDRSGTHYRERGSRPQGGSAGGCRFRQSDASQCRPTLVQESSLVPGAPTPSSALLWRYDADEGVGAPRIRYPFARSGNLPQADPLSTRSSESLGGFRCGTRSRCAREPRPTRFCLASPTGKGDFIDLSARVRE